MNYTGLLTYLKRFWKILLSIVSMGKGVEHGKTTDLIKQSRIVNKMILIKITFKPFNVHIVRNVEYQPTKKTELHDKDFHLKMKNK